MVQFIKECVHNLLEYRRESKRIDREIQQYGIYTYIEKNYGFGDAPAKVLKSKHA